MVLKPRRMARIRIIGADSAKEKVVAALHDFGVIQLEAVTGDVKDLLEQGKTEERSRTIQDMLQKFRGFENSLPKFHISGKRVFSSFEDVIEEAKTVQVEPSIWVLKREEEDLDSEIKLIRSRIAVLERMTEFNYDLRILNGQNIVSFLFETDDTESLKSLLESEVPDATIVHVQGNSAIVCVPRTNEHLVGKLATGSALDITQIPEMSGLPSLQLSDLRQKLEARKSRLAQVDIEQLKLSEKYLEKIVQIREQLEVELKKAEISEKLASTKFSFVLEGWTPDDTFQRLSERLEEISRGRIIISKIESNDIPPTMLYNPRRIRLFEFFIRFYSLPQETEFDPTLIFALIFPIFFGLMVGDVGYGIIILGVSLWLNHRLAFPPKKSHLPKKLSNFVLMIMGPNALRILARALIPGSLIAIFFGVVFNSLFGFTVPYLPQILPNHSASPTVIVYLPTLLVISGYIGLGMVSLGLILGFMDELGRNEKKKSMGKIGWLMIAWGVALFGLGMLHQHYGIASYVYIGVALAGLALVFLAEGSRGAMELPSIISHVLSYTRIVGILLSSVILAYVVDSVFQGSTGSIGMMIFGGFILVLGQIFNLAIAVFEPGIQGARLIYVEFFSKFFHGNGRPFVPFNTKRNYTVKQYEFSRGKGD